MRLTGLLRWGECHRSTVIETGHCRRGTGLMTALSRWEPDVRMTVITYISRCPRLVSMFSTFINILKVGLSFQWDILSTAVYTMYLLQGCL